MSHIRHSEAQKTTRSTERRNRVRTMISTPVRVRGVVGPDRKFDETTTTVNLSPTGILIETSSASYYRTMRVSVALPYEESATVAHPEQEGRVVRITELREGRRAVAISLVHASEELLDSKERKDEKKPEAAAKPTTAETTAHSAPIQATGAAPESGAPFILVVESESAASEFMKTYLTSEGYEVITVKNSVEARSVLDERIPSLLIAEIEGEGMPGFTLCSHCKETPRLKPVPVMLVTSSAYPSDYAKAHKLGAVVCMAKPYKRERLGHVVRLLAPPPNANRTAAPRPSDPSRLAAAKQAKTSTPPPASGRKFRLPVFGR